jgi:hypothetical protein
MCLRKRGSFQRNEKGKEMNVDTEDTSRISAEDFHQALVALEIRQIERIIEDAEIMEEYAKDNHRLSAAARERMLQVSYETKQQAQGDLKAVKEGRRVQPPPPYTNISKEEWIEIEKKRISDFFHEQALKDREIQQEDLEKLMTEGLASHVKRAVDLIWEHLSPEQLEGEMNHRFEKANMKTRISIEVHRNDNNN